MEASGGSERWSSGSLGPGRNTERAILQDSQSWMGVSLSHPLSPWMGLKSTPSCDSWLSAHVGVSECLIGTWSAATAQRLVSNPTMT